MEVDRLIKNLDDEAWRSKWVEGMSDKKLFTALAACNQNPGPVIPSTRELYEQLMLQIIKGSPAETVTSIDKYLASDDEARIEWLAADNGNLDDVDQLPTPLITPVKDRETTRSASRTPPLTPSTKAVTPAPTTPLSGNRERNMNCFGLRSVLRSARKEERSSSQDDGPPVVIGANDDVSISDDPFIMRKREVGGTSPRAKAKPSPPSPLKVELEPAPNETQKVDQRRIRFAVAEGVARRLRDDLGTYVVWGFIALVLVVGFSFYLTS